MAGLVDHHDISTSVIVHENLVPEHTEMEDGYGHAKHHHRMAEAGDMDVESEQPSRPEAGADAEKKALEREQDEEIKEEHVHDENLRAANRPARIWLFASLLITLFVALIASIRSDSSMIYAFLGFLPVIICILIFIALLEGGYKDVLFWLAPLVVCVAFLALGEYLNALIGNQLDVPVLAGVNMLFAYIILMVLALVERVEITKETAPASVQDLEHFEPEKLDQYIHTIEDKCKALNFVIGRVYRSSNGGTKQMREKLRIPSEWYNEFNEIKPGDMKAQRELALDLLKRIHSRLSDLLRPEKDVFESADIKGLKNIARDDAGKDRVLDVLTVNDSDPVEDYFLGAVDFCKRIESELEKL